VADEIDLALGVLDHQLIDSDGRRCGKVDDLELEGVSEGAPRVVALLVGPGAWPGRGRLGRLAAALARQDRTTHVPWEQVKEIDSAIRLRATAAELRLARGEERARDWVEKLPGANL
jgi:sporulation protein YlmC with PRC-barrel domain